MRNHIQEKCRNELPACETLNNLHPEERKFFFLFEGFEE